MLRTKDKRIWDFRFYDGEMYTAVLCVMVRRGVADG